MFSESENCEASVFALEYYSESPARQLDEDGVDNVEALCASYVSSNNDANTERRVGGKYR